MKPIFVALNHRITGEPFDAQVGQLACILGGIAILAIVVLGMMTTVVRSLSQQ